MADTIQIVRWSFSNNSDTHGSFWLDLRLRDLDDTLWTSIRRTNLESLFRESFQVTEPLWYRLWINSPLTQTQCRIFAAVFADINVDSQRRHDELQRFIEALNRSLETQESLHVELAPPGHTDMGWITTFVHCPRCKVEGPLKRWQESYPEEPINCLVCGHTYSPAATHSAERDYESDPVECGACHSIHRTKNFADWEIKILEDRHYYREASEELAWLRRVASLYERYPELERYYRTRPFPGISNAAEQSMPALPPDMPAEDLEVIEYLRYSYFSLPARLPWVEKSVKELQPAYDTQFVSCPKCGAKLE